MRHLHFRFGDALAQQFFVGHDRLAKMRATFSIDRPPTKAVTIMPVQICDHAGERIADSNEEGATLLALQIRQQLSTTVLSLASQASRPCCGCSDRTTTEERRRRHMSAAALDLNGPVAPSVRRA